MIYGISDLHLGFSVHKPMHVFGTLWEKHYEKIKKNWEQTVRSSDLVLIPGDISWAMSIQEAKMDFNYLRTLPGKKVLIKGNHDYWWKSLTKVKEELGSTDFTFLQNDSIEYENISICGTRGWLCPNENGYTEQDEKIYNREVNRLKMSLDSASSEIIFVMMHFPPMNSKGEPSDFTKLMQQYPVHKVIYGHLHGKESFNHAPTGTIHNIEYELISADYLDFQLKRLNLN